MAVDSTTIVQLQAQLDSLQREVMANGIAKDFFHDIIVNQATLFVILMAVVLFILGLGFFGLMKTEMKRTISKLKKDVEDKIQAIDGRMKKFEKRAALIEFDLSRSMAVSNQEKEAFAASFGYWINVILNYPDDWLEKGLEPTLSHTSYILNKSTKVSLEKEGIEKFKRQIDKLKKSSNQEISTFGKQIEEEFLKKIYG